MPDATHDATPDPAPHPAEFVRLCEDAVAQLQALRAASPLERGTRLAAVRDLLADISTRLAEMDLLRPGFADEQAMLTDAASALQAIDLDRGGPHVPRFVDRIIQDLRHIAAA